MKKLLSLLLAAMLLPMAMNAQLLRNTDIKVQHAPYTLKSFSPKMMVPNRANLGENQMIMGHYDTDDYTTDGLGITGLPGTIPIGTIITPNELALFRGGKIVKFRVALAASTTVSRVFVAPVSSSGSIGATTEWSCSVNSVGWNEVELETPYEINLDDNMSLLIGFDYKQTSSNYPISAVEVGDIYPSYIYYQGSWQNVGLDAYGNLSVQCVVESDNFPDYMISLMGLAVKPYTQLGDDILFGFSTRNAGVAADDVAAEACTYDVLIDGEVVATITNPEAFGGDFVEIYNSVPSAGVPVGRHTLTIRVGTLNGEPVENPLSVSRDFTVYEFGFDRQMHLIEEFTSNSCMYCPLGINMLKVLYNMRDDIAMVAIHGNQSQVDPSNTAQCDTLFSYMGATGWPSAAFDRSTGWEDDETIAPSIGYYEQYHQQIADAVSSFLDEIAEAPSFATININSKIDAETNEATITIDGQVTPDFTQTMGRDAKLTVYLTEDSLIYKQNNNGTWVQKYRHDHVLRLALGSVCGNALNITGETFKNEYTVSLPASWNTDKMEVIAFVSRPLANGATGVYTDMAVNQAFKRKLGEFDEPTSMRGDVDGDGKVNIDDVTALINFLLTSNPTGIDLVGADCDGEEGIDIDDVTALINFLLTDNW